MTMPTLRMLRPKIYLKTRKPEVLIYRDLLQYLILHIQIFTCTPEVRL